MAQQRYDFVVAGGGPAGSVTAIALANRGARVAVLEAHAKPVERFAGEWFHPTGVAVLERLGIEVPGAAQDIPRGRGFVVFPNDLSTPIILSYPDGGRASACEHSTIVATLWNAAASHRNIDFIPQARVSGIENNGQRIHYQHGKKNQNKAIDCDFVVGAVGRSSKIAADFGCEKSGSLVSYMAGIELNGIELPFEGYGHIIGGKPAPMLMYRFAPDRVRLCVDLPAHLGHLRRDKMQVWQMLSGHLPEEIAPAVKDAFENQKITWTTVHFRPKGYYGHARIALVGDTVGHFHPLTAGGLTMGFLDAECLAQSKDLEHYRKRRIAQTYVPELLSNALYQVFIRNDDSARAIRETVFDAWRHHPKEPARTMRILTGANTNSLNFTETFFELGLKAALPEISRSIRSGSLADTVATVVDFAKWMRWPLASAVPSRVRGYYRHRSDGQTPFGGSRTSGA